MEPTDLTLHVLREIRDEIKNVKEEVKQVKDEVKQVRVDLSARIDETNLRLGERIDHLDRRQTVSEIRLATEIIAVAAAVREVRDELRQDRALRARVDDHERRIGALESEGA